MNTERRDTIIEVKPGIYEVVPSVDTTELGKETTNTVREILDDEYIPPKKYLRRKKKGTRRQYRPDNDTRTEGGRKIRTRRRDRLSWKEKKSAIDNELSTL